MPDFTEVVACTVRTMEMAEKMAFFKTVFSSLGKSDLKVLNAVLVSVIADSPPERGLETSEADVRAWTAVAIAKLPGYDTPGELSGTIRRYSITVKQYPGRRFVTWVDAREKRRLSMAFVERDLGLSVNRKTAGGNSETLARAIYRHLLDRMRNGDGGVTYKPLA